MQEEKLEKYLEAIQKQLFISKDQLCSFLDQADHEIEPSPNTRMLDELMEWVLDNPQTSFALNPDNLIRFTHQVVEELPKNFTNEEYTVKAYTTLLTGLEMIEGVVIPSKFRDYVLE